MNENSTNRAGATIRLSGGFTEELVIPSRKEMLFSIAPAFIRKRKEEGCL